MANTAHDEYVAKSYEFISQRWADYIKQREACLEKAIKYLFLVNSGGAVSFLAFLGTSAEMRNVHSNYCALVSFVLGIIFVGFYLAIQFQSIEYLTYRFIKGFSIFYRSPFNESEYRELLKEDADRQEIIANKWPALLSYIFAYGSLVMFLVGCGLAGLGLFK